MSPPLDAERWQRIEAILDVALEQSDETRRPFLDEACADDPDLRAQIEALLEAEGRSGVLDTDAASTLIAEAVDEAATPLRPGAHLGPYRIDRMLGTGGMGVVFAGWDTRLERQVAIKLLPASRGHQKAEDRFLREARAASHLDHPNICAIHDLGWSNTGQLYIVMALYRGETLDQRIARGPLPVDEARDLALQMARGLERAHEAGIVHRDVKPANVLVTEHGETKILDFGIAKIADDTALTLSGEMIGTPAYMAPEQALGATIDARTDVWALGVLLYEMIAGRRPFRSDTTGGVIHAVLDQDPPPLAADVPQEIAQVVKKALAKNPEQRYQAMSELIADLAFPEASSTSLPPVLPRKRRPGTLLAAGVGAAVLIAAIGSFFLDRAALPTDLTPAASPAVSASTSVARETAGAEDLARAEDVTTSSPRAWRYYVEARELATAAKGEEAIPLYEKAVELDPEFALALAALGNLYANYGRADLAREVMARAVENADRLPVRARDFVVGEYYSNTWTTYGEAIAAFERGVALYPDDHGMRGNLAGMLVKIERYEEAIVEYRRMIERKYAFAPSYFSLATSYAALDSFAAGYHVLDGFAKTAPDNWFIHFALGWHLTHWGRLDEAAAPLARAESLRPGDVYVRQAWWRLQVLRGDYGAAAREARRMTESGDPFAVWVGETSAAWTALYDGRSEDALTHYAVAAATYPEPEANTALARCFAARLHLELGAPERALAEAEQARREAPGEWPELEAIFLAALAHQASGRPGEADALADELTAQSERFKNAVEERQVHLLRGHLALDRGEIDAALSELGAAADLLPPRGVPFHDHVLPDHARVWFALGEAELAAGRPERAAGYWERLVESGVERIEKPVLFVRGFERLAAAYEELGEADRAAAAASRFAELWRDGDFDRR